MDIAVCPGIAWHSGTASAACPHRYMTRPWVLQWLRNAAPCAMTPCGSCTSGSKGRPTAGSQGCTAIWPVPKPWSTCQSMLHRATPSPPRPPMAPCRCTAATLQWDLTTWATLALKFPLPSSEETWLLRDGRGHQSTRSAKRCINRKCSVHPHNNKIAYYAIVFSHPLFLYILLPSIQ